MQISSMAVFRDLSGYWRLDSCFRREISILGLVLLMLSAAPAWAQNFSSPTRIALGPEPGQVLVSDGRIQAIVSNTFDKRGRFVTIDVPGRPVSVAYGWSKYYVGNESTDTIDVVNRKGRLLYTLGDDFLVQRPSDIAIAIDQELVFVTDPAKRRVLVFHADGPLLYSWPGDGEPELYAPTGIAVDPVRGEVLVSDFGFDGSGRVHIYDFSGTRLASINGNAGCSFFSCNTGPGNFSRPQGLAINEQGYIYVVDSMRGQVLVFDRDTLGPVDVIGTMGTKQDELMLPLDLVIEPESKDLYVTSNRTGRVVVFSGKGQLP